MLRLY
jgi:hypothetical protein